MKYPKKVSKYIVDWLSNYLINSKNKGFVVGVSGGIDSAVTSKLCALSGFPVYIIEMPINQEKSQVARAKEHMKLLKNEFSNVTSITTSLTNVFDTLKNELKKHKKGELNQHSLANTRARLRMTTLYYYAGHYESLVVGTGNKVEDFGIGFYTKYGDGGVDLSPIADLLKSDVFSLGKFLKINSQILNAKPTDGLWDDNRTDEDQMGIGYDEIEEAMNLITKKIPDKELSIDQIKSRKIYKNLNKQNRHKMTPIPICKVPVNLL
ncbi:MAG: NAD(+) synthase [Flavobacteriaceae bacterium]|nr:NAD(+) synthase [Flavobacteriaceae bacterium]